MPQRALSEERLALSDFAAAALDWPAVRALYEPHAISEIGLADLRELEPRADESARAALARARELIEARLAPPCAAVRDPAPLLARARSGQRLLRGEDLAALLSFLVGLQDLDAWTLAHASEAPSCRVLFEGLPAAAALRTELARSLDPRGELRDEASPRLADLRRAKGELASELERSVRALAASPRLKGALADGFAGATPLRAGRYVLALRASQLSKLDGIVHERSASGETVFVEPRAAVEPGNRLAALRSDEEAEQNRVLAELARLVLAQFASFERWRASWSELELAAIAAARARQTGARLPLQPGDAGAAPGLLLRAMRHPLLAAQLAAGQLEELVPLDLRLGGDFDMLVITGPNTGGKTLALKSAGLAALLTRCALPFECDAGTTVPLYRAVVADIGDEQEIAQSLSTFSAHLVRIARGLERAAPGCLVLLDELGGGTDPDEGAALGEAVLEALLARGASVLASTHLSKLKEFAFRHARVENASVEFDVASLRPRYRLLVGLPAESRALAIARRLGLDERVLARAAERFERRDAELSRLLEDVRAARRETDLARTRLDQSLAEAGEQQRRMAAERDALAQARSRAEREAQRMVEERVRDARAGLERARALLGQVGAAARAPLEQALAELERALSGAAQSEQRQSFLAGLKKGDLVWVPRFARRLYVLRVDAKRAELLLRLGQQEVRVAYDEVTAYEGL